LKVRKRSWDEILRRPIASEHDLNLLDHSLFQKLIFSLLHPPPRQLELSTPCRHLPERMTLKPMSGLNLGNRHRYERIGYNSVKFIIKELAVRAGIGRWADDKKRKYIGKKVTPMCSGTPWPPSMLKSFRTR